jgi:predicted chitinase
VNGYHFLAQVSHETLDLTYSEESASGEIYEGRTDLGNTKIGDGVRFKGRGLLQITGRKNYTSFEKYMNNNGSGKTFDFTSTNENAKKISNSIELSCLASGYYWKFIRPKLNKTADKDDVFWVSVYINGWAKQEHPFYPNKSREPNHMKERFLATERAKKIMGLRNEQNN